MESGEKFWTGAKRFPRAADLEMSEEQHTAFVLATANLLAAGCGLSPQEKGLLPLEHPQRDVEGMKRLGRRAFVLFFKRAYGRRAMAILVCFFPSRFLRRLGGQACIPLLCLSSSVC